MACLQLFVWSFTIWLDKPTPGNAAKGLRYRNDAAFQSLINSGKGPILLLDVIDLCAFNDPHFLTKQSVALRIGFQTLFFLWVSVKTGLEGPGLTMPQKMGFLLSTVAVPYGWARLQALENIVGTQQVTI